MTPATLTASPLTPYPLTTVTPTTYSAALPTPLGLDDLRGPVIVTRYHPASSQISATHKRGAGEVHRHRHPVGMGQDLEENHRAAAATLAARLVADVIDPCPRYLIARGHDADAYYWVSVGAWAIDRLTLALEACRALEAAAAGGADAESLALPVALARMATGTDQTRRLINGARDRSPAAVDLLDHLGRTVATLPGRCSLAGAVAAAAAAGWPLGAAATATAARLQGPPDPEAVALALEARGGCPAVIATLKGVAS